MLPYGSRIVRAAHTCTCRLWPAVCLCMPARRPRTPPPAPACLYLYCRSYHHTHLPHLCAFTSRCCSLFYGATRLPVRYLRFAPASAAPGRRCLRCDSGSAVYGLPRLCTPRHTTAFGFNALPSARLLVLRLSPGVLPVFRCAAAARAPSCTHLACLPGEHTHPYRVPAFIFAAPVYAFCTTCPACILPTYGSYIHIPPPQPATISPADEFAPLPAASTALPTAVFATRAFTAGRRPAAYYLCFLYLCLCGFCDTMPTPATYTPACLHMALALPLPSSCHTICLPVCACSPFMPALPAFLVAATCLCFCLWNFSPPFRFSPARVYL